jgi:hypothetical protein
MPNTGLLNAIDDYFKSAGCDCPRCTPSGDAKPPASYRDWSEAKLNSTMVPVSANFLLTVEAGLKAYKTQVTQAPMSPALQSLANEIAAHAIDILAEKNQQYLDTIQQD